VNLWLEEFNRHLIIAGFRNVKIKDVNRFFHIIKDEAGDTCVQFLDASLIASDEHLRFAVLNALNAFANHVCISSNLAIEILLYASAQRQIKEALRLIGVQPSTRDVAAVILGKTQEQTSKKLHAVSKLIGAQRDDSVTDLVDEKQERIKKLFAISKTELEAKAKRRGSENQALVDLVVEHMALLVTQR
jgi:tRNA threonylcarbamoyladenosine modification (KEOPS) complex Cgi121 subunit